MRRNEALAVAFKAFEWPINRRTGDVHYSAAGSLAIVFGLEMAVKKYRSVVNVEDSEERRESVAKAAAKLRQRELSSRKRYQCPTHSRSDKRRVGSSALALMIEYY